MEDDTATPNDGASLFSPSDPNENLAARFEKQATNIEASGQEPGGETE
jgi:hypothetical protein